MSVGLFCRFCGASVPADSAFCPKCGKGMDAATTPVAETGGAAIVPITAPPKVKPRGSFLGKLVYVAFGLIGLGIWWVGMPIVAPQFVHDLNVLLGAADRLVGLPPPAGNAPGRSSTVVDCSRRCSREQFRAATFYVQRDQLMRDLGKPDSTQSVGGGTTEYWYYGGRTYDPITGRTDTLAQIVLTVVSATDSTMRVQSVNFN